MTKYLNMSLQFKILLCSFLFICFYIQTAETHADTTTKQLKELEQGETIIFANREWIVLEPDQGYLWSKESVEQRGYNLYTNNNRFDTSWSASQPGFLNQNYYDRFSDFEKGLIQSVDWNVGKKDNEEEITVKAHVAMLSYSEWEKYKKVNGGFLDIPNEWISVRTPADELGKVYVMDRSGNYYAVSAYLAYVAYPTLYLNPEALLSAQNEILTPKVVFHKDGNTNWAKKHETTVEFINLEEDLSLTQYQWSKDSVDTDSDKWIDFVSDEKITSPSDKAGGFYLHIRGLDKDNQVMVKGVSKRFNIANQLKTMAAGEEIHFAARDWIILDPEEGYLYSKLAMGFAAYDSQGISRWDPNEPANLAYELNKGHFSRILTPEQKAMIKPRIWNIGWRGNETLDTVEAEFGLLSYNEFTAYKDIITTDPNSGNYRHWLLTREVFGEIGFTIDSVSKVAITTPIATTWGYHPTFVMDPNVFITDQPQKTQTKISFQPDGDNTWAKSHQTVVNVYHDYLETTAEFVWSKDEMPPNHGWEPLTDYTVNTPVDVTGDYYLHVRAENEEGSFSARSSIFRIDNTKPDLPVFFWTDDILPAGVPLTVMSSDSDSGVKAFQYRIKSEEVWTEWLEASHLSNSMATILTTDFPSGSTIDMEVKAIDYAGNESEIKSRTFFYDPAPPVIEVSSNGNIKPAKVATTTVHVSSEIGLLDILPPLYFWSKDPNIPLEYGIPWDIVPQIFENGDEIRKETDDGEWYLYLRAIDRNGKSTYHKTDAFVLDNTAPTLDIELQSGQAAYRDNTWTDQNVSVLIKAEDLHMESLEITQNGEALSDIETFEKELIFDESGIYKLEIVATDEAGNQISETRTIKIDQSLPTTPVITTEPEGWTNADEVKVTIVDGEDEHSGVEKTEYRIGADGEWITYENPLIITVEGETLIYARTIDRLGHTSEKTEATVQIKRTIPAPPTLDIPFDNWTNAEQVDIDILVDEAGTTIEYQLNGTDGDWIPYEESLEFTEDGEITIYARAVDLAGNISETVQGTVKIDRTSPEISTIMTTGEDEEVYETSTWTKDPVNVSVLATDAIQIQQLQIFVNGTLEEDVTDFTHTLVISEPGVHEVVMIATDQAGNETIKTRSIQIDQTAPTAPTIATSHTGWTNAEAVQVTVTTGEDNESGIARTEYRVGVDGEWQTYGEAFSIATAGETKVEARTIDHAGNVSESSHAVVQIKRTTPTIPKIEAETNNWTNAKRVPVSIISEDEASIIEYQLHTTKGDWLIYTENLVITDEGETTIYARTVDQAGNRSEVVSTQVKIDRTSPVLNLKGNNPDNVHVGEKYLEAGYQIDDNLDKNVDVVVTGEVNTNQLGSYDLIYTATDHAGNQTAHTRTVDVIDEEQPAITLKGDNPVILEVGSTYKEAGAIAQDNMDGEISDQITITNQVNTSKLGNYQVIYQVTDSSGNQTEASRMVQVVDTTVPIITLLGEPEVVIELGADYQEKGAIAEDNYDGDLSKETIISGSVDVNQAGTYQIVYTVTDSSGNTASITRTIHVVDHIAPTDLRLEITETTTNSITFNFSATDLSGIKEYILSRNGKEIARINGQFSSYTDGTLNAGTTYAYELVAVDSFGNMSEPVTIEAMTKEVKPKPEKRVIQHITTLSTKKVAYGTALTELNLPTEVEVVLTNGEKMKLSVTWNKGKPAYDSETAGSYFFTGELKLSAGLANPNQHKALIQIIVEEKVEESKPGKPKVIEIELDKLAQVVRPGAIIQVKNTQTTIHLPNDLPEGTLLQVTSVEDLNYPGLRQVGEIYDFIFTYPKGKENYTGEFILIMKIMDDSTNAAIYHWNTDIKEWERIGGKIDEQIITAKVPHFSIYGVFAEEEEEKAVDQEEIDLKEKKTTNGTISKESSNPSSASAQKTKETDNADKTVNKLPNTSTNQYTWLLIGLLFLFSGGIWFMANKKKTNK